jgi:hypothetical protein
MDTVAPSRELYVYWRCDAAQADVVLAAARAMQRTLRAHWPALVARLLVRTTDAQGEMTVMETYATAAGIDTALEQHIEASAAAALSGWCRGKRHVEVFSTLPD